MAEGSFNFYPTHCSTQIVTESFAELLPLAAKSRAGSSRYLGTCLRSTPCWVRCLSFRDVSCYLVLRLQGQAHLVRVARRILKLRKLATYNSLNHPKS